MRNAAMTKKMV